MKEYKHYCKWMKFFQKMGLRPIFSFDIMQKFHVCILWRFVGLVKILYNHMTWICSPYLQIANTKWQYTQATRKGQELTPMSFSASLEKMGNLENKSWTIPKTILRETGESLDDITYSLHSSFVIYLYLLCMHSISLFLSLWGFLI